MTARNVRERRALAAVSKPTKYVARLCWNSESWVRPAGESALAEIRTSATTIGYGHEEWPLNLQWVLDGWK